MVKRRLSLQFPTCNKKLRSLKKVDNINERYEIGKRMVNEQGISWHHARHLKLDLECSIKIITKNNLKVNTDLQEQVLRTMRLLEGV